MEKQLAELQKQLTAIQADYKAVTLRAEAVINAFRENQKGKEEYLRLFAPGRGLDEMSKNLSAIKTSSAEFEKTALAYVKSMEYVTDFTQLCELKAVVDGTSLQLSVLLKNVGSLKAEAISKKLLGTYAVENAEKLMLKYDAARQRLREYANDKAAFDKAFELSSEKPAVKTQNNVANTKPSGNSSTPTTPSATEQLFPNIKVGATIQYGHYPQNADGKDSTPIDWQVLDIQNGRALVISKYALDCKRYNRELVNITWEACTLRKWLNSEFINRAFTAAEQKHIPIVTVKADKNPTYSTTPGNNTQDKVFLLSIPEVLKYFPKDGQQLCKPTAYTVKQGAYANKNTQCSWWWLRSPGSYGSSAAGVYGRGGVFCSGRNVGSSGVAIRPALWILKSSNLKIIHTLSEC